MGIHKGPYMIDMLIAGRTCRVLLTLTDASHGYVELFREDSPVVHGTSMDRGWELRGVRYHGSIHMYKYLDGTWNVGPEYKTDRGQQVKAGDYDRCMSVSLKREDWLKRRRGDDGPSESTRNQICSVIRQSVQDWLRGHEDLLRAAEESSIRHEMEMKVAEIQEAEGALLKLKRELCRLQDKLAAVEVS